MDARISILKACQKALSQDPEVQQMLTGGVWTGEIPEGQDMPYASMEIDSGDTEWSSEPPDLERVRFSIVLYAVGAKLTDNLLDMLEDFFTNPDLDFTNNDRLVYMYPARRTTRSEFARDKKGDQIFTGALMFEAGIFRF